MITKDPNEKKAKISSVQAVISLVWEKKEFNFNLVLLIFFHWIIHDFLGYSEKINLFTIIHLTLSKKMKK